VTTVYLRYWASEPLMIIRKATMTVVRNKTGLGSGESPYTDQVDYSKTTSTYTK
jgi:hypothetical protein